MERARSHFVHRTLLLAVTTTALLVAAPACRTTRPLADSVEVALLQESVHRRAVRAQRAAVPLEARIVMVEADLLRTLVSVGDGVLVPRYLRQDGSLGPLHLEHNAAILSALAAKFAATGDEQARLLGERIIKGLLAMDACSGALDGFVPLMVDADTREPAGFTTHANAYTQLLFAYVFAQASFGPNEDVRRHVSLIYQRFAADRFALRHVDGSYVQKADLATPFMWFNARRTLDRRLLDETAHHLGDETTRQLVTNRRWRGPLLGPLHVKLFALELPTASSSWLNLQAMTALNLLGKSYEKAAASLARKYERDDNPWFRVIAAMNGADEDLAAIRRRLDEFPYPATSSGIVNSHRTDITRAAQRFVKFHATAEARTPLPLYEIGSSVYIWKRRLRDIDTMPTDEPWILLGHDLYQAYWFLALLERNVERRDP